MARQSDPEAREQELLERAREGDREAFGLLVEEHRPALLRFIRARLGAKLALKVDVEDVFQDSCLRAFGSVDKLRWRGHDSFARWLQGIARHSIQILARHHLRTKKRMASREVPLPAGGTAEKLGGSDPTPSRLLRRRERFDRLVRAFRTLSSEQRRAVLLVYVRRISVAEAARRMGRSCGAVSMLLLRAMRRLREEMGDTGSLALPAGSLDDGSLEASPPPGNTA